MTVLVTFPVRLRLGVMSDSGRKKADICQTGAVTDNESGQHASLCRKLRPYSHLRTRRSCLSSLDSIVLRVSDSEYQVLVGVGTAHHYSVSQTASIFYLNYMIIFAVSAVDTFKCSAHFTLTYVISAALTDRSRDSSNLDTANRLEAWLDVVLGHLAATLGRTRYFHVAIEDSSTWIEPSGRASL
ncbi:hypothetical protein BDY19DRAFT_903216 [Irpex rosettiformis]|uniref:Uncharacterized protein n=1 Tax=Irpex rosettiformis TaxID=378272 RepID=A0ACB8UGS0_9APHY|nr:hypothetical protein BDY19DRAFT_903216 [Irpex rosettiformis]